MTVIDNIRGAKPLHTFLTDATAPFSAAPADG